MHCPKPTTVKIRLEWSCETCERGLKNGDGEPKLCKCVPGCCKVSDDATGAVCLDQILECSRGLDPA